MERKRITDIITEKVVRKNVNGGFFGDGANCQTMTYSDGTYLVIATKANILKSNQVESIVDLVNKSLKEEGATAKLDSLACVSIGYGMTMHFIIETLK